MGARVGGLVERPLHARASTTLQGATGADARGHARVRRQRARAPVAALARASRGSSRRSARPSGRARRSRRSCARRASPPDADRGRVHGRSTAASRATSSICTSGASRSTTRSATRCCSRTRSTAQPLPPQHGYPLRLIVPGWYGMTHVKWLRDDHGQRRRLPRLAAGGGVHGSSAPRTTRGAGDAHAAALAARAAGDPGLPVARTLPRRGAVRASRGARGRAGRDRAGRGERRRRRHVGATRSSARRCRRTRGRAGASRGTRQPGEYELCCRASDAAGNTQPTEPEWNVGGYCNNAVQRVRVTVS